MEKRIVWIPCTVVMGQGWNPDRVEGRIYTKINFIHISIHVLNVEIIFLNGSLYSDPIWGVATPVSLCLSYRVGMQNETVGQLVPFENLSDYFSRIIVILAGLRLLRDQQFTNINSVWSSLQENVIRVPCLQDEAALTLAEARTTPSQSAQFENEWT